ncbi:Glyoxalase/Bleomycin resistance protein/Dioxygenase superfamily protein isoform 3 [Artemisia annua]|uniref:Glyoxalase/Bleomycin resistance protein/Dioxygenase superfamily protein isoform 3 n=1 Tax=Artemisia annua TaxID=35608 RepID=A0A2U1NJU8_ARTAN|nr:Glyoxalase/Bleomycin resistance protein/Dioxygenase superfamily protein isoform 3 [Artemisia annua]
MGYRPEDKNCMLELTYNYGITEYDKGNAYAQEVYRNIDGILYPENFVYPKRTKALAYQVRSYCGTACPSGTLAASQVFVMCFA